MNDSPEIFQKRAFDIFGTDEINEFLLMIYRQLDFAMRDGADRISLDQNSLSQFSGSNNIRKLPMVYGNTSIYDIVRNSMLKIFERDTLVNKHFEIEQVSEDSIAIRKKATDSD